MAKLKRQFVCQACGASHVKWSGQCSACMEWNTLTEELVTNSKKSLTLSSQALTPVALNIIEATPKPRWQTGVFEFDRVCGGGLVPGSVLLLGGDPGIGKSTLLLQVCAKLAQLSPVVYVSGEEAEDQIRLRAQRLGINAPHLQLATTTQVENILSFMESHEEMQVVVIDSIQTMHHSALESAAGTVSQVRHCAQEIIKVAKNSDICVILIGHVTKDGTIAGPRVLEHMVDAVLTFEGDRSHQYRILRGMKNRFGPTDEIGVFAMQGSGLNEVSNPSALFLEERQSTVPGSAVFAGLEGTRPVLVEIQALVLSSNMVSPRRSVVGWDSNRLNMILAVLESRAGLKFSDKEVYLNIVGGLKITEPAADLAVAAALASALAQIPLDHKSAFMGEIGLTGEIRSIPHSESRLKEAQKLGFESIWLPKRSLSKHLPIQQNIMEFVGDLRKMLSLGREFS